MPRKQTKLCLQKLKKKIMENYKIYKKVNTVDLGQTAHARAASQPALARSTVFAKSAVVVFFTSRVKLLD